MLTSLLGVKLGAALAAGTVSLGGVAAVTYSGTLPAGLQDFAHTTVGAPAAGHGKAAEASEGTEAAEGTEPADDTAKTAVGPDAKGPAAFGLCTAWTHVQANGQSAMDKSVAFRNLATAAGGETKVAAYCATIPHPGSGSTGKPSTHPSGKSGNHTTDKPTKTTGKSGTHTTGKPLPLP